MSKISLDIVDQSVSIHCWGLVEPTARPSSRSDNHRVGNQPAIEPGHRVSLAVVLTAFHLLNIISIVAFGAWKVISTGSESWVSLSKTEFGLMTLAGVILYYLQILKDDCPEICPGFFQVDLAPPIWKFIYRSEVYLFLLSLLPLNPAVEMLRFALDNRHHLELGNQSPSSHTFDRNALITAFMGIIFSVLAIMQQLTKVLRLRVLHRFLVHDIVTLTLLAVWGGSDIYVIINTMTSADYNPKVDDEYLFGHTMTLIPFALLLPRVEGSIIGILWFRLLKGVLVLIALIVWILSEKLRNLYYVSFVCGIVGFFLHFFTTAISRIRHPSDGHCSLQDNIDSLW